MHAVLICRIYFVRLKRRKFLWVAGWSSGTLSYYHLQTFVEQVSLSLLNFLSVYLCRRLSPGLFYPYLFLSFLSVNLSDDVSLLVSLSLSLCFRISHLCTYTCSSTDNEKNNPQQSYFFTCRKYLNTNWRSFRESLRSYRDFVKITLNESTCKTFIIYLWNLLLNGQNWNSGIPCCSCKCSMVIIFIPWSIYNSSKKKILFYRSKFIPSKQICLPNLALPTDSHLGWPSRGYLNPPQRDSSRD